MEPHPAGRESDHLRELDDAIVSQGRELAVFLVFDRPTRVEERPGLARTFFAQRCVSDLQLEQTIDAFRSIGAYVELFEGERPFFEALVSGRLHAIDRDIKIVYNGIEGGISVDGFEPGRKALLPAAADAFDLVCSNSNAYACAVGRHKFHYFTILRALGVPSPLTWHYRSGGGWAGGQAPPHGTKVIAKSTFEAWSVGVTDDSVFTVGSDCDERVDAIAKDIGQAVTVQQFISGTEVCVPVFATPAQFTTPPVESILARAPQDPDAVVTIGDNLRSGAVTYSPYSSTPDVMQRLQRMAIDAFDVLELTAFARIDFRVADDGGAWVIDVGVSPGLGTGSSGARSLAELGFDHPAYLRLAVAATLASRGLLR